MAKIGDIVRYLNSVGGGRIVRIEGNLAYVDEDGFETPVMLRECVVVQESGSAAMAASVPEPKAEPKAAIRQQGAFESPASDAYQETDEGETLNVVLGYTAVDLKKLSTTNYEAYLVNDSNYYLYFTYLTRGDGDMGWTTRYAGLVEPGIEIYLGEVLRDDLSQMDRVAVQYIPFKEGRQFQLKAVACVEYRLDTTKFFKLHCFQRNTYFDDPVIALPIVKADMPQRQIDIDPAALQRSMREKQREERHAPRPVKKRVAANEPLVVDLHIAELVDTTAGLSNADMLNLQIDKFREVMDANLKNHGKKIIFIHGKGEGVLRQALLKELNHAYKGHDVQDASFREYGYGATQVKIR